MTKLQLILISTLLAGGATVWLVMSNDSGSDPTAQDDQLTSAEDQKPGVEFASAEEPSQMPSEPSTEIGETVAIGELETPDDFELPVYTNHFEITGSVDDGLTVTLLAIINRPEQYAEYEAQLKQFKSEALQYLEDNGVDVTATDITYEPELASEL